jgi:hypothetical protein
MQYDSSEANVEKIKQGSFKVGQRLKHTHVQPLWDAADRLRLLGPANMSIS